MYDFWNFSNLAKCYFSGVNGVWVIFIGINRIVRITYIHDLHQSRFPSKYLFLYFPCQRNCVSTVNWYVLSVFGLIQICNIVSGNAVQSKISIRSYYIAVSTSEPITLTTWHYSAVRFVQTLFISLLSVMKWKIRGTRNVRRFRETAAEALHDHLSGRVLLKIVFHGIWPSRRVKAIKSLPLIVQLHNARIK